MSKLEQQIYALQLVIKHHIGYTEEIDADVQELFDDDMGDED